MSGLRDELGRLADDAPVASVPGDTWARAQRSRRRDGVLQVVGAVAVAGLVLSLLVWWPGRGGVDPADGSGAPALPDRLYDVPERMAERRDDDSWAREEVTPDLAIGRGAVAWTTPQGLPVVVDAEDGAYHLLDLPGFVGNDRLVVSAVQDLGLALSPDGRLLAYGYGDPGLQDDDRPVPSGVRVVDLASGGLREVPLPDREGTLVERIRFSADGRWIVWSGRALDAWTRGQVGAADTTAGRIAPGGTMSEALPLGRQGGIGMGTSGALDIADDGTVVSVGTDQVLRRWDGRRWTSTGLGPVATGPIAVTGDGGRVALRGTAGTVVVDPDTGAEVEGLGQRAALPRGWTGDGLVTLTSPVYAAAGSQIGFELSLVDADGVHPVAVVEGQGWGSAFGLSVAVDLVTADRPSVARPAPGWPWSTTTRVLAGLGAGGLGAVLLLVAWRAWSRHRLHGRSYSWSRR